MHVSVEGSLKLIKVITLDFPIASTGGERLGVPRPELFKENHLDDLFYPECFFLSSLMSYSDNYSLLKNTNLSEILLSGLHRLRSMTGDIPFGHLTPDPCQQISVLLVGGTAGTACGSAGTNHASINTSDLNKHLRFSQAE